MNIGRIKDQFNHSESSVYALASQSIPMFMWQVCQRTNFDFYFLTVIVSITKKNKNVLVLHSCLLSFSFQTHISWSFSASLFRSLSISTICSWYLPPSLSLSLPHSPSISPSLSPCHTGKHSPPRRVSVPSTAIVNIVSTLHSPSP